MNVARLDESGMIVELFDSKDLDKKLHPDLIKKLVRVPVDAEVGMYFVDKKLIEKRPDNESILEKGKWIKDPAIEAEKAKEKKLTDAKKRLKAYLKAEGEVKDYGQKQIIADLFLIVKAGDPDE